MEAQGHICSACSKAAVCFCTCTEAEVLFCNPCFSLHSQEHRDCRHPTFPVEVFPYVKQPGFLEKLQTRTDNLPDIKDMALNSLGEVEKCIAELRTKIEELSQFYGKTVEQLTEKKRQIEESMEEVESTVLQEQPELKTAFGRSIRDCLEGKSIWVEPFRCKVNDFDPRRLLNLTSSPPLVEQITKIPYIDGHVLSIYDLKLKQGTTFNLSVSFSYGISFCILDNDNVLCIGGSPASDRTCMLDSTTQKISAMPRLNIPRYSAGVIKVHSTVYAFGSGFGSSSDSSASAECEKLPLADQAWTNLSNMHYLRHNFHPASYLDNIYLPGQTFEVFNTTSETFDFLPFSTPSCLSSCHSVFVIEGVLFLTSYRCIGRWKINSAEEIETWADPAWTEYSKYPPFVVGNEVYIVTSHDELFQYNVETKVSATTRRQDLFKQSVNTRPVRA